MYCLSHRCPPRHSESLQFNRQYSWTHTNRYERWRKPTCVLQKSVCWYGLILVGENVPWSVTVNKWVNLTFNEDKLYVCIVVFTVFICSFLLLAPLFGYLGDRYNRKYIMIGGLTVWLLTAAGSSFVSESVSETCSHISTKKRGTHNNMLCVKSTVSSCIQPSTWNVPRCNNTYILQTTRTRM